MKPDVLTIDDNTIIISNVDNIDLDNHDSLNEDDLWNEDSLKKYMLDMLNILKFLYSTSSETLSALLTNNAIYRVPTDRDKNSYDTSFKSWKAAFAAERLV